MFAAAVLPVLLVAGFSVAVDLPPPQYAPDAAESLHSNQGPRGESAVMYPPMQYAPLAKQADSAQYAAEAPKGHDNPGFSTNAFGDLNLVRHPYSNQQPMSPQMMTPQMIPAQVMAPQMIPPQGIPPQMVVMPASNQPNAASFQNYPPTPNSLFQFSDPFQPQPEFEQNGFAMGHSQTIDNCIACLLDMKRREQMEQPGISPYMQIDTSPNAYRRRIMPPHLTNNRPRPQTIWG